MLDEEFEFFLENFGAPQQATIASEEVINKYNGKLPDQLLKYWKAVGFCCFKVGINAIN